jgi:outer membrane protein OmpA-like peptidoglycan-associated protein
MKRLNLISGAAALAAVFLTASPSLMAQENGNRDEYGRIVRGPYETNRFGDNWFISVGGGINSFWNEGLNFDNMKIAPSIDANFGKWFTPAVGMRVGYQGINSQVWSPTSTVLGPTLDADKDMYPEKFGYMYFHGDFLWNASDAIGGYKETRFWNLIPYLHAGYYRSYGLDDADFADNELAAGVGLLHDLRLADRLDLVIDMRATAVNGRARASDGVAIIPSVTMGLAVDLGWPGFIRASTVISGVEMLMAEQIAAVETAAAAIELANISLKEQNDALVSSNKKLKRENAVLRSQPSYDIEDFFEGMGPATIYFNIGETELSEKELNHLDFIASNILSKVDQETMIYITVLGLADGATGTHKRNEFLSKARGEYVYKLLVDQYGISPGRIIMDSEVIQSPENPALDRAVVIKF